MVPPPLRSQLFFYIYLAFVEPVYIYSIYIYQCFYFYLINNIASVRKLRQSTRKCQKSFGASHIHKNLFVVPIEITSYIFFTA